MSYLFLHKFYTLFYGHYFDNTEHTHHAIQWCSASCGKLELLLHQEKIEGKSVLIAPDCPHKIINGQGELFLLFLNPETTFGQNLIKKYLGSKYFVHAELPFTSENISTSLPPNEIKIIAEQLFKNLDTQQEASFDSRITMVLECIDQNQDKHIKIPELANRVCLSTSRLQHLFKINVGIPIQSYLLWKRMLYAVHSIQKSNDLTKVAYETGFSDSAHLSRTFKKMFGVNLKELFKTSGHVEVIYIA